MQPQHTSGITPISSALRIKFEQQEAIPCCIPGHSYARMSQNPYSSVSLPCILPNPAEEVGLIAHPEGLFMYLF